MLTLLLRLFLKPRPRMVRIGETLLRPSGEITTFAKAHR